MFRNLFVTFALAALLILIGVLLPWASVLNFDVAGSETDDGKLMLIIMGVIIIAAGLSLIRQITASLVLGVLGCLAALALAVYEIVHLHNFHDSDLHGMTVSIGAGLWLCIIGAVVGLIGVFLPTHARRTTSV